MRTRTKAAHRAARAHRRPSLSGLMVAGALLGSIAASLLVDAAGASGRHAPATSQPSSLTAGHPYRHGAEPTLGWTASHRGASTRAIVARNLSFGGGISGVGVTTGAPLVYLVFWGSQWGTQGTNAQGNATFSGDPRGVAPDLEAFLKGLGTGSETWSGVMTQYCDGVATGSRTCPGSAAHVGYPYGGAYAGLWEDSSAPAPAAASAHQIGVEAVSAATHFGNTTQASNRNTQYVIVSPTGTDPDSYLLGGFCAWHDYTGDSTLDGGGAVNSPDGLLAFTNLPYIPDAGASCGQNFVNAGSAGTLDGVTIVEGHEYAETITDQFPAGGWTDSSGAETGDKCAWISSGQGAAQDITLTTGTFAVQSTWANDFGGGTGGCEVGHAIVTSGNSVSVTNPGSQTSTVGTAVSLQVQASDSASGQTLTYSATGLPAGLSISASSGLISGTPTTPGSASVLVTATDTTGASGSASFSWTVNSQAGNTVTVTNPGSQTSTVGTAVSLQVQASDSASGQRLTYSATGLPAGLSIDASSGSISGTPTTPGSSSVLVTATDSTGAHGTASFSWTVNPASGGGIVNGGFETGNLSGWTAKGTAGVTTSGPHSGTYAALLGSTSPTNGNSSIAQSFTAGTGKSTLHFWYNLTCPVVRYDWATATLRDNTTGRTTTVLARTCVASSGWLQVTAAVVAGHSYTLTLVSHDDDHAGASTYTKYDDVSLS